METHIDYAKKKKYGSWNFALLLKINEENNQRLIII